MEKRPDLTRSAIWIFLKFLSYPISDGKPILQADRNDGQIVPANRKGKHAAPVTGKVKYPKATVMNGDNKQCADKRISVVVPINT